MDKDAPVRTATKYRVTAVCFDAAGVLLFSTHPAFDEYGRIVRVIDTATNELFADCEGAWDIEDRYEEFWNRLDDSWEWDFPAGKERVKVVRVEPLYDEE